MLGTSQGNRHSPSRLLVPQASHLNAPVPSNGWSGGKSHGNAGHYMLLLHLSAHCHDSSKYATLLTCKWGSSRKLEQNRKMHS